MIGKTCPCAWQPGYVNQETACFLAINALRSRHDTRRNRRDGRRRLGILDAPLNGLTNRIAGHQVFDSTPLGFQSSLLKRHVEQTRMMGQRKQHRRARLGLPGPGENRLPKAGDDVFFRPSVALGINLSAENEQNPTHVFAQNTSSTQPLGHTVFESRQA